jgi:hypothetical protein
VCKLKVVDICSSCGPGSSDTAARKLAAQVRLLGAPCPILACAQQRQVNYCPRDCRSFPCENFSGGPYPYSQGYLAMQQRRRRHKPPGRTPSGTVLTVPAEYWEELKKRDIDELCRLSMASLKPPRGLLLPVFNRTILADLETGALQEQIAGRWQAVDYPLLELVVQVYLLNAAEAPLTGERVSVHDLRDAHFFQGPHALKTAPLLEIFGRNPDGFTAAATSLGGVKLEQADVAFMLLPLPKIPVVYLLWQGDEEFEADMTVLFDRSIECHLSADAIWGVVQLVSDMLLMSH